MSSLGASYSGPSLTLQMARDSLASRGGAIPNLPGYRQSPAKAQQMKQSLRVQHGYMLVRSGAQSPASRPFTAPAPGGISPVGTLGGGTFGGKFGFSSVKRDAHDPNDLDGRYSIASQQRDRASHSTKLPYASEASLPKFLKFDRKVLSFQVYYEEPVAESDLESERVRKCVLYYYLEDDTMQLVEPQQENSGMPQGSFIRRHKIPKAAGKFFTVDDLFVGAELDIYRKLVKIYDCDAFTRTFLEERAGGLASPVSNFGGGFDDDTMGSPLTQATAPSFAAPEGEYDARLRQRMQRETGADLTIKRNRRMHPMKEFMEASLGKPQSVADLGAFLAHDREVLRFRCVWDDSARLYGDVMQFKLHYFVADDTIEILQVREKNSGRDASPKLLRRQKLPSPGGQMYHWRDLNLGDYVEVFSRQLLLVDADGFTRDFVAQRGAPIGEPVAYERRRAADPALTRTAVPPFNGFGSEEDSLRSVYSIRPTKPSRDASGSSHQGRVMRYSARMRGARCEDRDRKFTLQFYPIDGTIGVREPPLRNSGHVGGSFLARSRVRKPARMQKNDAAPEKRSAKESAVWGPAPAVNYYAASDLFVGAVLEFLGHEFLIEDADEFSLRYMEQVGAPTFALSDFEHVRKTWQAHGAVMAAVDAAGPGPVRGAEHLQALLQAAAPDVTLQECITISRAARRAAGQPPETGPYEADSLRRVLQ
ncbi:hypothetical protein M885DRAFT_459085 [Pelagophyceae sp. CCMP2097]|nr:hypothetical protein M885DRAFT_459085 [Pelagophyceae sp. CCMP2097]